jgi:hypothetical protein
VTGRPGSTIGFVALDAASPPALSWERDGVSVWAQRSAHPTRTIGAADSSFFVPYGHGRAYRAHWSSKVTIEEARQRSGWRLAATLGWEPSQLAMSSSGTGRLFVAASGRGRHRGLWLYSGTPRRPLARRFRLTVEAVAAVVVNATWHGNAVVVWATRSAIYARRIGDRRAIRIAADRGRGRALSTALADDGSVVVTWLRGVAGSPARVQVATISGAGHAARAFSVGPRLRPQTSPEGAIGRGGDGLLMWAGRSDDAVAHVMAAPIRKGRPDVPVQLAALPEAVAIGDLGASADGSIQGGVWLQQSGDPSDGAYALFVRNGRVLAPERVSDEPPARPLTTSLEFDPCTARPYVAWAAHGNEIALSSREPLAAPPTPC